MPKQLRFERLAPLISSANAFKGDFIFEDLFYAYWDFYFLVFLNTGSVVAQSGGRSILEDESAAGARASLGLYANAAGKAFSASILGLKPNTFKGRFINILFAATAYQVLSFNTNSGLAFKPFKFNKEWQGYWTGFLSGELLDVFLRTLRKKHRFKFILAAAMLATAGTMITVGELSKTWRYANDGPLTLKALLKNRHSFWVHFVGSGGLYWTIANNSRTKEEALISTILLAWLWEAKDGYIKWENVGHLGGDGFSFVDGSLGTIAAIGSFAISKWIFPAAPKVFTTSRYGHQREHGEKNNKQLSLFILPKPDGMNIKLNLNLAP